MRLLRLLITCVLSLAAPARALGQAPVNRDPAAARLITEDIPRFWKAVDRMAGAATRRDSLRALFEEYYLEASPGLEAFVRLRIGSPFELLDAIRRRPKYYASIRENTGRVAAAEPRIRDALRRFKGMYADATFPDVYFLIGRLNSGGTLNPAALYIGAEFYSRAPDTPVDELNAWERMVTRTGDLLPCIVLHELMHYQQQPLQGRRTLLASAFREGAPDWLAQRLCGTNINDAAHGWLDAEPGRAAQVWKDFRAELESETAAGRWIGNANNSGDRPADLGYVLGFRIAEAYYNRAADKVAALRDIIRAEDPAAMWAASGFASP